jgi:hypothetical protein
VTAVTVALLLVGVKALFFFADNGFRDPGLGGPLSCRSGADCVYQRYLADGRGADLTAQGVIDSASFGRFYWSQQLATATFLLLGTTGAAVVGGVLFGATQRKRPDGLVSGAPGVSGIATGR